MSLSVIVTKSMSKHEQEQLLNSQQYCRRLYEVKYYNFSILRHSLQKWQKCKERSFVFLCQEFLTRNNLKDLSRPLRSALSWFLFTVMWRDRWQLDLRMDLREGWLRGEF